MTATARTLARALSRRAVLPTHAARSAGLDPDTVRDLLRARTVPTAEVSEALAHTLTWPSLVDAGIEDRTGVCPLCRGTFVWDPRGRRRVHCRQCQPVARRRASRARQRELTLTETRLVRQRLSDHQEAVRAMCLACEPDGLCRTADCPLRRVSPLPLARTRVA